MKLYYRINDDKIRECKKKIKKMTPKGTQKAPKMSPKMVPKWVQNGFRAPQGPPRDPSLAF